MIRRCIEQSRVDNEPVRLVTIPLLRPKGYSLLLQLQLRLKWEIQIGAGERKLINYLLLLGVRTSKVAVNYLRNFEN